MNSNGSTIMYLSRVMYVYIRMYCTLFEQNGVFCNLRPCFRWTAIHTDFEDWQSSPCRISWRKQSPQINVLNLLSVMCQTVIDHCSYNS